MHTLLVRHTSGTDAPAFVVERLGDGKAGPETQVPPPNSIPIDGRPNDTLTGQLRWYLEQFLKYPFPPELDHAERVRTAFRTWGRRAFDALFTPPAARRAYEQAVGDGFEKLTLRVVSDSPAVLGWPWEALEDPEAFRLATQCQVERRLNVVRDPPPARKLPGGQVNVLLVIARPYERDVKYRSIARPLVEMAARQAMPVSVHVLRPPTFDQLRAHLKAHPGYYHILHFDGHGAYRADAPPPDGGNILLQAPEGHLIFENADGKDDPIESSTLSELLREHAVPAVVLNACQSAMVDEQAADPFASVAAALLKAGTRSVAAMAYALYVSGAQRFLPAFYTELFGTGDMAKAGRAGRQEMVRHPGRVCARGTHPLDDWVVPVLYQQESPGFSFGATAEPRAARPTRLPEEVTDDKNPYGFIGRDGPLLELERAMHREPAGILVTGLGGVGKTTLARGFLKWLDDTEGLGTRAFWFSFVGIHNTDYVFNRLGEVILSRADFATLPMSEKVEQLAKACREKRIVIVWDNFESVRGIAGTAVTANLSADDANHLRDFLAKLRGGATKVLITSRSPEEWLGPTNRGKPIGLTGLDGEERWELANKIVRDLGLKVDRSDVAVARLMDLLRGHPLAMRVVLTKLEKQTAKALTDGLGANFQAVRPEARTEEEALVFATLRFATDALPPEWRPLLVPLSLHEEYVQSGLIAVMAKKALPELTEAMIEDGLRALSHAGLLWEIGTSLYEMHPLLTGYLRAIGAKEFHEPNRDRWERAFVNVMGTLADELAPRPLHEQRVPFMVHGANFHTARETAGRKAMHLAFAALAQVLGSYAQNTHRYEAASTLYAELADRCGQIGKEKEQASAYHQLGRVAEERRDFDAAEDWYRKSLEVSERLGDEHGAASTYHQLGRVAVDQQRWEEVWQWFLKALAIYAQYQDNHNSGIVVDGLAWSYREAPPDVRTKLQALGRKVGLPDEFLQKLESPPQDPQPGS
jgi:tetratricopeptide (TPR) repeat protein